MPAVLLIESDPTAELRARTAPIRLDSLNTRVCDKFSAAEKLFAVSRSEGTMGEAPRAAGGASPRGC